MCHTLLRHYYNHCPYVRSLKRNSRKCLAQLRDREIRLACDKEIVLFDQSMQIPVCADSYLYLLKLTLLYVRKISGE